MTWRDDLVEALKSGDKEELKRIAYLARNRVELTKPVFDFKTLQSEGREPGEDQE